MLYLLTSQIYGNNPRCTRADCLFLKRSLRGTAHCFSQSLSTHLQEERVATSRGTRRIFERNTSHLREERVASSRGTRRIFKRNASHLQEERVAIIEAMIRGQENRLFLCVRPTNSHPDAKDTRDSLSEWLVIQRLCVILQPKWKRTEKIQEKCS